MTVTAHSANVTNKCTRNALRRSGYQSTPTSLSLSSQYKNSTASEPNRYHHVRSSLMFLEAGWDATHFIPTLQQEHKESTPIKSLLDCKCRTHMSIFCYAILIFNIFTLLKQEYINWPPPKNENAVIYSPHAVLKLYDLLFNIHRIYFSLIFIHATKVNGVQCCLDPNILQNIYFCVQQKKVITWGWINDEFSFLVNCFFKHRVSLNIG